MLLDQATENGISALFRSLYSAWSVYAIGRELGQSHGTALNSALGRNPLSSRMTFLEQSYVAGKVAQEIGPQALASYTEEELINWIRSANLTLSDEDVAILASLRNETEKWIQGRSDAQQYRLGLAFTRADRAWRAALASSRFGEGASRTTARNAALRTLVSDLSGTYGPAQDEVDRIIQSDLNQYFQHGMVSGLESTTKVYKIPRTAACPLCLRLHLQEDGSPRIYTIGALKGNNNIGIPSYGWAAVLGPTHPYCYCQLYVVKDETEVHGPDDRRAAALSASRTQPAAMRKHIHPEEILGTSGEWNDPISGSRRTLVAALKKAMEVDDGAGW